MARPLADPFAVVGRPGGLQLRLDRGAGWARVIPFLPNTHRVSAVRRRGSTPRVSRTTGSSPGLRRHPRRSNTIGASELGRPPERNWGGTQPAPRIGTAERILVLGPCVMGRSFPVAGRPHRVGGNYGRMHALECQRWRPLHGTAAPRHYRSTGLPAPRSYWFAPVKRPAATATRPRASRPMLLC